MYSGIVCPSLNVEDCICKWSRKSINFDRSVISLIIYEIHSQNHSKMTNNKFTNWTIDNVLQILHNLNGDNENQLLHDQLSNYLKILKNNHIALSLPLITNLVQFLFQSLTKFTQFETEAESTNRLIENLKSILPILADSQKIPLIITIFPKLISISCDLLKENKIDFLPNILEVSEILVASVDKPKKNKDLTDVVTDFCPKLLIEIFICNEPILIASTLSLFSALYRMSDDTHLSDSVWELIIQRTFKDESFVDTYYIFLYHMLHSNMAIDSKCNIVASCNFWTILKRDLQNMRTRKRALNILRYAVFNILKNSQMQFTDKKVWDHENPAACLSWWENFFIISDCLEEKQSHLIPPAISLIRNLMHDQFDEYWIVLLIQYAMSHDSRTVRIETFTFLFTCESKHLRTLSSLLLKMINCMNDPLFIRKLFTINKFEEFKTHFKTWISEYLSDYEKNLEITAVIFEMKWSVVPLYYFLEIFIECDIGEFHRIDLPRKSLENFIHQISHLHNVPIRIAIKNLIFCLITKYSKRNSQNAIAILELLSQVNKVGCIRKTSLCWMEIGKFLKESLHFDEMQNFLLHRLKSYIGNNERCSDTKILDLARDMVLFSSQFPELKSASSLVVNYINQELSSIFDHVKIEEVQISEKLENYVNLICCIIEIDSDTSFNFFEFLNRDNLVLYLFNRIIATPTDFIRMDFYVKCLENLHVNSKCVSESISNFFTDDKLKLVFEMLRSDSCIIVYSALKLFLWLYQTCESAEFLKSCDIEFLVHVNERPELFSLRSFSEFCNNNSKEAVTSHFNSFWDVFCYVINRNLNKHNFISVRIFQSMIIHSFHFARPENLPSLFRAAKILVLYQNICSQKLTCTCATKILENCDESIAARLFITSFFNSSVRALEEINDSAYYSEAIKYWMECFLPELFGSYGCFISTKFFCFLEALLKIAVQNGNRTYENVELFFDVFHDIFQTNNKDYQFSDIKFEDAAMFSVDAFIASHIIRSDLRIEYETIDRINLFWRKNLPINTLNQSASQPYERMKLKSLNLLLLLCTKSGTILENVINKLTALEQIQTKRYYCDSISHREKHKKNQLLLILETVLYRKIQVVDKNLVSLVHRMFDFSINALLIESHQPSVRYLFEWLLIRLIIHHPENLVPKFWDYFSQKVDNRIGSVCSFIAVAFHASKILNDPEFLEYAVNGTLPWAMGQHFTARLYAQFVLTKLICQNIDIQEKYKFVLHGLQSCLKRGNAVKNAAKLQEDFYFLQFDPEKHFSFEVILWELPRLSNISRDEWTSCDSIVTYLSPQFGIPLLDETNSLRSFECSSWVAKSNSISDDKDIGETKFKKENTVDFQRKFVPLQNYELLCKSKKGNLVIVASLIDKAPNLGGLSRTCEVFAISKLVVNNLDIVLDKEFKSLSITSEKHLKIVEVKHFHLFTYLKSLKEDGYTIIGLEQATNSKSLDNFEFPFNSVVLLGNEKQGIPPNLLPVLDVCVEIPQMGLIRSLNVHVSASIIMWEYVKRWQL